MARFTARRVQAIQHGQPILSMIASFTCWSRARAPGAAASRSLSESLRSVAELRERWLAEAGDSVPERVPRSGAAAVAIDFRRSSPGTR